jgi:uncharacterized membrane protein YdbT with pleckstrin-like domain
MRYVEANLLNGEKVEHVSRLHWKVYIAPVFLAVCLITLGIVAFVYKYNIIGLILFIFSGLLVYAPYLIVNKSEFAVTSKRVIIKVGILRTRSLELFLSKVEGITVNQSFFGNIFNFGDIVITGSGGTKEMFSGIQSPLDFRKAVQQATDKNVA